MSRLTLLLFLTFTAGANAQTFTSITEIRREMNAVEKGADAGAFWNRVLAHKTMPLVFGNDVVFLWRGEASLVEWRGDFSSWESSPETLGHRLGTSDVWSYQRSFPLDARLDYKIVTDGKVWDLDTLNPHTQLGGYGPNSELRMPGWRVPENTIRREGSAHGTLSSDIPFDSAKLGYVVNYRVYTPAAFDAKTAKDLPVVYVTDGSDYWNDGMGSLVVTLDNLLADRKIAPLLVVFIDPWDRREGVNRRQKELIPAEDHSCAFCEFLAKELVPAIDESYPTKRSREGRAIVGTSLGGLHATYMSTHYGSLFGYAGIQSPAFHPAPWAGEEVGSGGDVPLKAFINAGTFEPNLAPEARKLRDRYRRAGTNVKYVEVNEGHSWGQWRALLDDMLVFFYGGRTRAVRR